MSTLSTPSLSGVRERVPVRRPFMALTLNLSLGHSCWKWDDTERRSETSQLIASDRTENTGGICINSKLPTQVLTTVRRPESCRGVPRSSLRTSGVGGRGGLVRGVESRDSRSHPDGTLVPKSGLPNGSQDSTSTRPRRPGESSDPQALPNCPEFFVTMDPGAFWTTSLLCPTSCVPRPTPGSPVSRKLTYRLPWPPS